VIELRNVFKSYVLNGFTRTVARDISFRFPDGESVALLGRNGAGKSTMLGMIAGTQQPDRGEIITHGSVSWPVGFAGSFHPDLSGSQNVKFVARIYGVDTDETLAFVEDFADLAEHFHLPVRSYSSGMKSRLAFATSMAIPFDTYLIDEVTAVGDAAFRAKSEAILQSRLETAGAVIVSHALPLLERLCTSGIVLDRGRFHYYARVSKAIEHHQSLMRGQLPPWMKGRQAMTQKASED
jgi:capsular polysaccharide transport system ATP-binding protein